MFRKAIYLFFVGCAMLTSCNKGDQQAPSRIEHVIVIGVDGLSPDGIRKAATPTLDSMISNGAVKWNVRTVLTSASSQNWASMIMGAGPEQHGIIDNDWEMEDHTLPPIVQEADGRFPTIFSVLHAAKPEAEIGAVYHWGGFGRLFQKNAVNYDKHFETEDSTAEDFIRYIKAKKPTLGFVHFDHVDHAGHHGGHGTAEYYASVTKTDSLVKNILTAIDEAGIADKTLVIVWADHGGIGKGHGGATPQEAEIAGIFYGEGVKKKYEIKQQVYTYDLASTIAFVLGVAQPYAWIGRPVKPAFEGFEEPENLWLGKPSVEAPVIQPARKLNEQAGGLYIDKIPEVRMSGAAGTTVRYTTDGTDPIAASPEFKSPFNVEKTTVVKARAYDAEGNASMVSTAYFRVLGSGGGNGVRVSFYPAKELTKVPSFNALKKTSEWQSNEFQIDMTKTAALLAPDAGFAMTLESQLQIPTAGKYTFYLQSDDGSRLYVDGKPVVDNDGNHGVTEKNGSVELTAGKHAVRIEFYNNGGGYWLDAFYKGPGLAKQLIPANALFLK